MRICKICNKRLINCYYNKRYCDECKREIKKNYDRRKNNDNKVLCDICGHLKDYRAKRCIKCCRIKAGIEGIARKGKYDRAYRIIAENLIGRRLKSNEVVHHINYNRLDNRAENLMIVTRKEHKRLHRFDLKKNQKIYLNDKELMDCLIFFGSVSKFAMNFGVSKNTLLPLFWRIREYPRISYLLRGAYAGREKQ